jgi:hypothetical protein
VDPDLFMLDGYHCPVFELREKTQGGGVAIYVKNDFNFSVISKYSFSVDKIADSLFIQLETHNKKKYIFGSIYHTVQMPNTLPSLKRTST